MRRPAWRIESTRCVDRCFSTLTRLSTCLDTVVTFAFFMIFVSVIHKVKINIFSRFRIFEFRRALWAVCRARRPFASCGVGARDRLHADIRLLETICWRYIHLTTSWWWTEVWHLWTSPARRQHARRSLTSALSHALTQRQPSGRDTRGPYSTDRPVRSRRSYVLASPFGTYSIYLLHQARLSLQALALRLEMR